MTCDKTNHNQLFRLHRGQKKGYFNIVGNNGKCVSLSPTFHEYSKQNGNGRLSQKKCIADTFFHEDKLFEQTWRFKKQGNDWIIQNLDGKVMHNKGGKSNNGNPIFGWRQINEDLSAQI